MHPNIPPHSFRRLLPAKNMSSHQLKVCGGQKIQQIFASNRRESWKWTLKTFFPEWVTEEHVHATTSKALAKGIQLAQQVQILELTEGSAHQALHIGSFVDEGPIH